jgi:hypothetical protein
MLNFKLSPWFTVLKLSSFGQLPGVWLRLKTNTSGFTLCPIFRVKKFLNPEDGTNIKC